MMATRRVSLNMFDCRGPIYRTRGCTYDEWFHTHGRDKSGPYNCVLLNILTFLLHHDHWPIRITLARI